MPLTGITDSEVLSTVCFVVTSVCSCYIGFYVCRCKTDSIEKIQDRLFTPSCSIIRSGFREIVAFISPQSVIVSIEYCESVMIN